LPESILPRGLLAATGELYHAKLHPLPHSQNIENEKSSGKQTYSQNTKNETSEKGSRTEKAKKKKE
jgi:hypothetical protein